MSKAASKQVADAPTLRRVLDESKQTEPPAVVRAKDRNVLISVKLPESTAIAPAKRAQAEGLTQKAYVAQDRRPPRRGDAA